MDPAPQDLTGQLLIAMPGMGDPRFANSVIYVCAYSRDGAMGLIVNKPAPDLRFSQLLEQMEIGPAAPVPDAPDVRVHFGGPVETARGFVLHSSDFISSEGTITVEDGVAMTATLDVIEALARGEGPRRSLLALGYSGWGPGQLDREIAQNGWLTVSASDEILFGRANEHKWTAALKRLGINPLTLSDTAGRA